MKIVVDITLADGADGAAVADWVLETLCAVDDQEFDSEGVSSVNGAKCDWDDQ